ncbi:MAG: DUF885 domain-containing protein, partial [Planctomycetota bacterium]|nr:DUF885 domain-containing protein [Planctomycetota bacterium]
LLERLRSIDPSGLESAELVTHRFLQNLLEGSVGWRACRMELWNVSPTWTGWQSEMAQVASAQAVETESDREEALTRFGQLPVWLDDEIENLRTGLSEGFSAPQSNVRAVIEQIDAMLSAPLSDSPFVRMAKEEGSFRDRLETMERDAIRPAMQRYRDFLNDEYLGKAREAIGVSANSMGLECYVAALKYHTTVDLTAKEVHDLGLARMAALREEMREIGKRSFGTEDIDALLQRAKTESEFLFSSREEMVAYARAALARAKAAAPDWFGRVPEAEVVVTPYPAFQEKTAPSGFYSSAPASGGPGTYWINTYKAETQSKAGLEATAFHETYPGHHHQGSIALEIEGLHPVQKYFYLSGYGEGWALYTERLADEMGLYGGDIDRLGMLSNEALRAARLVVDSGMHALGWSRQRAIDYLLANTTENEASATSEIDRYIAVPGQATSYMVGSLEIAKLRAEAEAALGDAFDVKAFHDRVLEDGSLPLWVLRDKIERWVADQAS